ncbi:MAG TPA: DoxX family protein [Candidatus Limnocylindrales bacterium]|nr:DoxX family protein [Candidatus Limnocylindrales bacterium]
MPTFDAAVLVLRLGVGLIFAAHGAQKVFGWWGGSGFGGWVAVMVRMGFRPPWLFAAIAAGAELVGGLALAIGFLTPLAAMVIVGQSMVIIFRAHWPRGFFNRDNGFEFPLALVSGAIAALLLGPGDVSVDTVIGLAIPPEIRVWLLGLGVVGGLLAAAIPRILARPVATPESS